MTFQVRLASPIHRRQNELLIFSSASSRKAGTPEHVKYQATTNFKGPCKQGTIEVLISLILIPRIVGAVHGLVPR